MKHKGWLAMALLLAMPMHPLPAQAQEGAIRCESQDGRLNRCRVPWQDAELVRQESRGACIRDESWGMDRDGVWVDHGCRGLFAAARGGWDRQDRRDGWRDDRDDDRDGRRDRYGRDPYDADRRGGWHPGRDWDRLIRLDCHSNDRRYQLCQVDVGRRGRVSLERQVSDSSCREGYSWGWNRAGVWVAHGCRASFLVDRRW